VSGDGDGFALYADPLALALGSSIGVAPGILFLSVMKGMNGDFLPNDRLRRLAHFDGLKSWMAGLPGCVETRTSAKDREWNSPRDQVVTIPS
jgi:hypothetical protein